MIFYIVLLCLVYSIEINCANLDELYKWKYIDFVWENEQQKADAIDSGNYIATKNIPYDVDEALDGRTFVTVVKDQGVPATLAVVTDKSAEGGPLLRPYPSWLWNSRNDCRGIIGVYRVTIACNYLWVLDTGKTGETQVCPAQLLAFDLSTDRLIKRVAIPSKYATNKNGTGLLVTPVVDMVDGTCHDPLNVNVYMADIEGYGMVIWDGEDLFRIESKHFVPEKRATRFSVAGQSFDLSDGLLGMAITSEPDIEDRLMYFRPLASFSMSHVAIIDLNIGKYRPWTIKYHRECNRIRSQSAAQAFSSNGILFYSSSSDQSLICWNRRKRFNKNNNVQFMVDKEGLQFASGVKVVRKGRPDESLLVMTNRFQQVINNVMNFSDVNFRIFKGCVEDIVMGTNCE